MAFLSISVQMGGTIKSQGITPLSQSMKKFERKFQLVKQTKTNRYVHSCIFFFVE